MASEKLYRNTLSELINSINKRNSKPWAAFVVPIKYGQFFRNVQLPVALAGKIA